MKFIYLFIKIIKFQVEISTFIVIPITDIISENCGLSFLNQKGYHPGFVSTILPLVLIRSEN